MASGIHEIARRPKLLVVDDDADIRASLRDILEEEGFSVVEMPDGECALLHLEHDEPPAVMLLDLMMPKCSGWEVLAACRKSERLRDLPIIVMSAMDPRASQLRVSIAAHVTKPISVTSLVERVKELVAASNASRRNAYRAM